MTRPRSLLPLALLAALAAGAGAGPGAPAWAAPPAATPTAAPALPPSVAVATTPVQLVTGERVLVTGDRVQVAPAPGGSSGYRTLVLGAHVYVVPSAAEPYVGRVLDLALFDVTRLAALAPSEQLRVRVAVAPGAHPVLPGVQLAPGATTGSLSPASAAELGRALVAQRGVDAAAGRPTGSLFAGVTAVAPASATAPPVQPSFAQVTLSVRVLDERGRPAQFASLALANTDDTRRYAAFVPVVAGLARVSVPLGHYSASVDTSSFDPVAQRVTTRLVTLSDVTVSGAGQSLVADARTATAQVGVQVPRPAAVTGLGVRWDRLDGRGGSVGSGINLSGSDVLLLAPAPAARVGEQHVSTTWSLTGTGPGRPYTYDLLFTEPGVSAHQVRTVTEDRLATVDARYSSDGRQLSSLFGRVPRLPFQFFVFGTLTGLETPGARTEQVLAPADATWGALLVADAGTFSGFVSDVSRSYRPGTRSRTEWLRPALLPGVPGPAPGGGPFFCLACRSGDLITLALAPLTDSTPGHVGSPDGVEGRRTTHLRLERDGQLLVDHGNNTLLLLPLPAAPATYRVVLDVDRAAAGARLGTAAHTELTFRSGRGDGPALPAGSECLRSPGAVCRALPLLQVRAPLPVRLDGSLAPGPDAFDVVVSHVVGAAPTPVTALTAETSTDGVTWRALLTERASDGHYRVLLDVRPDQVGRTVDLRLTARDSAGGTLSQTSRSAFAVAAR